MADTHLHQSVRSLASNNNTTDPDLRERGERRAQAARGAAGALALGVLAVALQSAATATPTWAYYSNPECKYFIN